MRRHQLVSFIAVAVCATALVYCGSDDDPVTPEPTPVDSIAPFAVVDLACTDISATSVTLTWTATGDDTSNGTAGEYDVRYALTTIDEAGFATASQATGEPAPQAAGETETFTVTGLASNTHYYFAVKVADDHSNWSDVSNCPDTTSDVPDFYDVTSYAGEDVGGVYSPDGATLAFFSERNPPGQDIYAKDVRTTGGSAIRLTAFGASGVYAQFPSWAPDGSKIVFQCNVNGSWDLWVVDFPAGTSNRLTTDDTYDELYPEWSHDGTMIAFTSDATGQYEIYTIPAGGGAWTQITATGVESGGPTWSPDDTWIAFHHRPVAGSPSIWKIRLSDSYVWQLTSGGWAEHPSWSPDGLYITFDQAVTDPTSYNVSYISANGGPWPSGTWTLVSSDDGVSDRYPSWSPDSKRITYTNGDGNDRDVVSKKVR